MKTILAAVTAATFALTSSVQAGGLADAVMEDEIIVLEETPTGTLPGWVIPLAIVGIVIAVASSSDNDEENGGNGVMNLTNMTNMTVPNLTGNGACNGNCL